ncbi:MAG TPA: hypothetical protein VGA04_07930 [Streptosporangiaceae bacterium]
MAVQGPIPVEFGQVFPRGVFAAGGFEPVRDFEASKAGRFVQSKDKATGLPMWVVDVIDGDSSARDKTARVKVAAADQPVLPPAHPGMPFVPVEFAGLTVTPYVNQAGRLAYYRRHWHAVLTITGLAPLYRGRTVLPVLGKVQAGPCTDRVPVRLVSGQSPQQFADRAEGLAHGFGAHVCRVRAGQPGMVVLELVRRDALAEPMPPSPSRPRPTCGRCLSASAKTGRCSRCGCMGRTCLLRVPRARARALICGAWCGRCSRRWRPGWCGCSRVTRS